MAHSIKPGRIAAAAIGALGLLLASFAAVQTADASRASLKVTKVNSKVSGNRLLVSARVGAPRGGHLYARIRLDGRLLCHSKRGVKGPGTYGVRCAISRGALAFGISPSARGVFDRSGTPGASLRISFEDYEGNWLKSLIPLPPLPPIPAPPA